MNNALAGSVKRLCIPCRIELSSCRVLVLVRQVYIDGSAAVEAGILVWRGTEMVRVFEIGGLRGQVTFCLRNAGTCGCGSFSVSVLSRLTLTVGFTCLLYSFFPLPFALPYHHPLLMTDRVELDSLPSRVRPPNSKSLKRSASVASLPTPPRTVRKRSRSRGSAYHSSDDEADDVLPVVSPNASPSQSQHASDELGVVSHKRRRIDAVVAELNAEECEDAFWLAGAPVPVELEDSKRASKPSRVPRSVSKGKPPSSSRRGQPTSTRRLSQSRAVPASSVPTTWSLLSPPPTRPRPPVTPPRKRPTKPMPVRDSPNNPFLVNSSDSPGSLPSSPVGPRTPVPDKETIHYVLYVVPPLMFTF